MHIQQKELNACIGKLGMCSRAEVHRSRELTVYWNVLEPEMIILTRMRGKKYQFQTMRSHLAFPRDLKLKDLQSVQLSMNMIQVELRICCGESIHIQITLEKPHGMRGAHRSHRRLPDDH